MKMHHQTADFNSTHLSVHADLQVVFAVLFHNTAKLL